MAEVCGADTGSSLRKLVDGFAALSDEYKRLAGKHRVLQDHLSAATDELARLRQTYPNETTLELSKQRESKLQHELNEPPKRTRNLNECLEELGDAESSLPRIKDAEFACFSVKDRHRRDSTKSVSFAENRSSLKLNGPRSLLHPNAANEQDFTVMGKPSTLRCPFVSPRISKLQSLAARSASGNNSLGSIILEQPTIQGDGSARSTGCKDPIQPEIKLTETASNDVLDMESALDGDNENPACPIRFLDQHSPEEVAKYFEEHKHELPRSHEACVKRFQANADSIRELDAKYGNLVSMVQGLGMKHQPMLPETPAADSVGNDWEQKTNKKVKRWVKAVSEGQQGNGGENFANGTYQSEGAVQEERVSYFDRPLKEVRVGESPSRPWGVPIPLKYLERSVSNESVPENQDRPQAPPSPPATKEISKGPTEPHVAPENPVATEGLPEAPTKKASKCPFDHQALSAAKLKTGFGARDFAPEENAVNKVTDSATATLPGQSNLSQTQTHIINSGVAIVADASKLAFKTFENQGTLVLGYSAEDAQNMLWRQGKAY